MPLPAVLSRAASALLVVVGGTVAAVGGVSLGASGLVAVALAAVVAACLAAGVVRDDAANRPRHAVAEVAWRTAVGTVAVLLLLTGSTVLAGGAVTALLTGCAVGALGARWAVRQVTAARRRPDAPVVAPTGAEGGSVRALSTPALGREWLRTSQALAVQRAPLARQDLVRRRAETLDELERRDPAGFARWLAESAAVDSDPAGYVSDRATPGYDAA